MTYQKITDNDLIILSDRNQDWEVIHKFGHSEEVSSGAIKPVTEGGMYPTPASAVALEIVSTTVVDTIGGIGAQKVLIEGLGADWTVQTETVDMNGTTAVALSNNYTRVYRAAVIESGTYANSDAGSHVGVLTIQESGAGDPWAVINANGFPLGQTEIGCYSIPAGHKGYISAVNVHVESNKTVDVYGFQRPNADDVTTPYTGTMRIWEQRKGISGAEVLIDGEAHIGPFTGPCDIGFMAQGNAAGASEVGVSFHITLEKNIDG